MAARKNPNSALPRREQLMAEHLRATPLAKLFPKIEQLRIEMVFSEPDGRLPPPSPQLRTLYSAAPAFFRFACPCADCDGIFDLTDAITALVGNGLGKKASVSVEGRLMCQGTRFRDHAVLQAPCPMALSYKLHAEAHRPA
jgi:hypothetical protein